MNRNARRLARAATALTAAAGLAALGGCYSASGTQLGYHSNQTVTDGVGAGDTLGAAMFQQHAEIAVARARHRYEPFRGNIATANVPVD